jgi:hypothetical protein
MEIKDLLINIIKRIKERYPNKPIGKTKLLKLAYLVEYFFYRKTQKRLLEMDWIFYHYGPWSRSYDEILNNHPFIIDKINLDGKMKIHQISIDNEYHSEEKGDVIVKSTINDVVRRFFPMDLKDILDYVYFDTEPMVKVDKLLEVLSFYSIKPEEHYKVKKYSINYKKLKKIRKEFEKRICIFIEYGETYIKKFPFYAYEMEEDALLNFSN